LSYAPDKEESGMPYNKRIEVTLSEDQGKPLAITSRSKGLWRPQSYEIEERPMPTMQEYNQWLAQRSKLIYMVNPPNRLDQCVAVKWDEEYHVLRTLLDLGANVALISQECCNRLSIPIKPTTPRLTPSLNSHERVLGTTPLLKLVYGPGSKQEHVTFAACLVTSMSNLYDLLLPNVDAQEGAILNTIENEYCLRGSSGFIRLPIAFQNPRVVSETSKRL
jgi:hypothetical protein